MSTGPVTTFGRALNYYYRLHMSTKAEIRQGLSALNPDISSAGAPAPNLPTPERVLRGPQGTISTSGGKVAQPARRQTQQPQVSRNDVRRRARPTPTRNESTVRSRAANTTRGSARLVSAGGSRTRKAIANTQADKRARDSGGLTSLQTSGIDGKGLRINRIR